MAARSHRRRRSGRECDLKVMAAVRLARPVIPSTQRQGGGQNGLVRCLTNGDVTPAIPRVLLERSSAFHGPGFVSSPGTGLTVRIPYLPDTRLGVTSGGVDVVESAAGIGEGTVLSGSVVTDWVAADEFLADGNLDSIAHDRDLILTAIVHGNATALPKKPVQRAVKPCATLCPGYQDGSGSRH